MLKKSKKVAKLDRICYNLYNNCKKWGVSIIEEKNNQNNDKNIVSDELKKRLKKIGLGILKKVAIIALPFIIILIILAAVTWFIFMDEGTWEDEERGNPSTYTNNVHLSTTDGITIDKMELVKQGLLAIGYTEDRVNSMTEAEMIEALDMSTKLGRTITSINDCTVAEILWCINTDYSKYLKTPEDLEYLLNAELVTQYPKIDGIPPDKLNGIIEFARVTNLDDTNEDGYIGLEDGPKKLTYISQEEFDAKFQNYIDNGNMDVFNYFTIDDQENAIIATWTQEDGVFESNNTTLQNWEKIKGGLTEETIKNQYNTDYTVTENTVDKIAATYTKYIATKTQINYKSIVQKYTLPFNYLWALLVMGESDEFVLNLAELAYNSEIVIGIYDSTTTTVTINTKNYTENFREREERYEDGSLVHSTDWTNTSYSYYEKDTKTVISNSTQIDIMYANTWIVEIITQYKRTQKEENFISEPSTLPDEEWSDNGSYENSYTRTETHTNQQTGETSTTRIHVVEKYFKEKKTTGQSQQTEQNIFYDKYEKVKTDIREKTDIDPNTDQNFVKLLRADDNARAILFKPINVVWLCDILSANSNTANMVELTKYLINKAKNPDDTSLFFDFSIFEPSIMNGVTGAQSLSTYLRQFSHSGEAPKSTDGKYYLMYGDGEGWPTIGNADIQWKSHYTSFAQSGYVLQDGVETEVPDVAAYVNAILERGPEAEYTDEEIRNYQIYIEVELVDEIGDKLQSNYYNLVISQTSGLNLSRQQLYALTAIAYNFGHLPERNGYTFKSVYEAGLAQYEVNSWEHNRFIWDNWWSYLGGGSPGHIPSRDAAFETYVKGVYDFSNSSAGEVFSRNYYIYYTREQLNRFDYAPDKTITRNPSNEEEIFTYIQSSGEGLLAAAEELHKKLEDEQWTYSLTGLYSNDIVASINHPNKILCCATYVSGVLYMSGYASENEINAINIHSSNSLLNFMRNRGDCIEITSYDDLQAGDIVFMTTDSSGSSIGHVQICAGDNQWYNAGSTDAIRRSSPYNDSSYARRHFVTAMRIN